MQSQVKWWRVGPLILLIALFFQHSAARPKKEAWRLKAAVEPYMVLTDVKCVQLEVGLPDDDVPMGRDNLEPLLRKDVEHILRSASIKVEGCSDADPILKVFLSAFHTSTWGFVVEVSLQDLVAVERYESRPPLKIVSMAPIYRVLRLGAVNDQKDPAGHMRRTISEAVQEFADDYVKANLAKP